VQTTSSDQLYFPTVKLESLSGRPLVKETRVRLRYDTENQRKVADMSYLYFTIFGGGRFIYQLEYS
jgi:hypothetical protein